MRWLAGRLRFGQNSESRRQHSAAQASGSTAALRTTVVSGEAGSKSIDTLAASPLFPSREPEEIITATEPSESRCSPPSWPALGYDVGEVEITVGTSYEAVGEALAAGTADVGLIPGGTYVLYDDGCDVLLTATRDDGLSIDSDSAKDWNDNAPTEATTEPGHQLPRPDDRRSRPRRGTGAGRQGQRRRQALTWEDVSGANWSVAGSSSPPGYIYPSLWLQEQLRQEYHRPAPRGAV